MMRPVAMVRSASIFAAALALALVGKPAVALAEPVADAAAEADSATEPSSVGGSSSAGSGRADDAVTPARAGRDGGRREGKSKSSDDLPEAFKKPPFSKQSLSVGAPNHGRLVRGRRLPHEPAMRLFKATSEHGFAHPVLIKALTHGAKSVRAKFPGSTLLVVELSDKDGGVLTSKRSHQSGRDGDVAFYALDKKGKRTLPKHLVHFDGSGKASDGSELRFDDERNWAFVEALANQKDSPVTHIFVDGRIRQRLLTFAEGAGKKPERIARVAAVMFVGDASEAGDAYFHVRVRCPNNQTGLCEESPK